MRISINITNYSWPDTPTSLGRHLGRIVRAAEAVGLDTLWVADHLLQADPTSTPDAAMLEAYTTLGFLAARSERIRLGTMVTGVTYRPPALLVKALTTLDVLSNGRAWLGLGAGYHDNEAQAMGLPLPPTAERFEHLEETLQLATQMWHGDASAFTGRHHQPQHPINSPQPVSRPHPPILVGGMGETKTLRLVARYADACNLFDVPDSGQTVTRKLGVLAEHCDAIGRNYDEIGKTLSIRFDPGDSPHEFTRRCADLAELGIDHLVLITTGPWTEDTVASVGIAAAAVGGH